MGILRRSWLVLLVATLASSGCGLSAPRAAGPRRVAQAAPPGTFSESTTFDFKPVFASWNVPSETQGQLAVALDVGLSNGEKQFRRDTFITNPRLANRNEPPRYLLTLDVGLIERGDFPSVQGRLRIVDRAETVVEDVVIDASISGGRTREVTEAELLKELGFQTARYIVCRTSSTPEHC